MKTFRLSCISVSVIGALISFSASATTITDQVTSGSYMGDPSVQIGGGETALKVAVNSINGSAVTIDTAADGNISVIAEGHAVQVAYNGSTVQIGSNNTNELKLTTTFDPVTSKGMDYVAGINALFGATVGLDAKNIVISAEGGEGTAGRGLGFGSASDGDTYNQTTVRVGSENTENIIISASSPTGATGVLALRSDVKLQAKNIFISAEGEDAAGVLVQNNTEGATVPENRSKLVINAENTTIDVPDGLGLVAFSNGYLEVNGNLTVNADHAIDARGNSTTVVNKDKTGVVKLKGDIVFETPGDSAGSGNVIDADVNIYLGGEESSWTGTLFKMYPEKNKDNPNYTSVTGFDLTLADGAQWNATVSDATAPTGGILNSVAANQVTLDGGVINASSASQTVDIENLTITQKGGVFSAPAAEGENGSLTSAQLSVENATAEEGSTMTVKYTGITSDQINAENQDDLDAFVAEGIEVKETAQEGDINGAWERETLADGTTSVTQAANTKLTDFSSVNAMSLVQWRNEINHLTKRLGDIRASEGTIGAWARVYGGESQWGGANEVEMDHTTIQVGGDYRINNHWIAGAAFSYTDSRADLANGDADGDSYSLAVYGTYTADGGSFLDLIGRYGYLKNDITAGNMALDTSSSAFSLSAEMGHTFRFIGDAAYVEPQIEFTYGFIGGDDATASNGVRIEQDDFQSFVTRVGVRAGYDFPQKKGSVYGMFSYSYDWMGDADGTASKDGLRQALSQDLGGGWVTYGVGAQIMLGDSAYFYGELERTSGGDIDNPYQFSAGVRMTF